MNNTITDITRITEAVDPTGGIETYLWDELTDGNYYDSVESMAQQLESAACAHGSWSAMIYTRDIYNKLADTQWQEDIDEAIESYADVTGETPELSSLGEMVTFAVDWVANELAGKLRSLGRVAVVTASVDSMDSHPDVIAFRAVSDALDWIDDQIERRICDRITESATPVTAEERDGWIEQESALFTITEERL